MVIQSPRSSSLGECGSRLPLGSILLGRCSTHFPKMKDWVMNSARHDTVISNRLRGLVTSSS